MGRGIKEEILRLFGIESDEVELVGLVILQAMLFGFQNLFTRTAVFAIFLESFTATDLPYLYIVTGLVVPLLGTAFTQYQRRTNRLSAYAVALNAVFILLALMVLSTQVFEGSPVAVFLLPVLYLAVFRFLELVLSGTKNTVFTLRQTKRLSGLITTGGKLSMLVGGLLVPVLLYFIDIEWLIIISVVMIFASKFNQHRILKAAALDSSTVGMTVGAASKGASPDATDLEERKTYRNYTVWILAIQAGLSAMYFAVDNAFLAEVKQHFSTAEEVGAFLGFVSAAAALLSIVVGALSGRVLVSRFGTIALVRLTPAFVATTAVVAIGVSLIVPGTFWVLAAFVVIRVGERALTPTVFYPSYDSLFQSLPAELSARSHSFSLTFSGPLAGAAVGVVLLVLNALIDVSSFHLSVLVVLVSLGMLLACRAIVGPYRQSLEYAVRSRRIERLSVNLGDEASLSLIEEGLLAERSEDVIYAFELLRQNAPERALKHHPQLVTHSNMSVRVYMVKLFSEFDYDDKALRLMSLLEREEAPAVQSEILWGLAQSGAEQAHDVLATYLQTSHHRLLKTVIAAMVKHGSLHAIIGAGKRLEELQDSESVPERALAAEIIGQIGNPAFYHGLVVLLNDPALTVREAALESAGALGSEQLLPTILEKLEDPQLLSSALRSLKSFGGRATEALWQRLTRPGEPLYLKRQVVELLVREPTADTRNLLVEELSTEDLDHLQLCLSGLQMLELPVQPAEFQAIGDLIEREGERAIDLLQSIERYAEATMEGGVQLRETLEQEYSHLVERVLLATCSVISGLPLRKIMQSVFLKQNKEIAFFCELIDERLPARMSARIVPLIEPLERVRRIEKLCKLYNREPKDALTQLTEISKGGFTVQNPWLSVSAARFLDQLVRRETEFASDDRASSSAIAEQVQCLKTLPFFETFPSSVLAQCLKYFQVRLLEKDDVLVERGSTQPTLYVVQCGTIVCDEEQYGANSAIGLDALLGDSSFGGRAVANERSTVLSLTREVFLLMLRDSFRVYQVAIGSLSSTVRILIDQREESDEDASATTEVTVGQNLVQQRLALSATTLFGTLPPAELEQVLAKSRFQTFQKGEVILKGGEVSDTLHYLISGHALLSSDVKIHGRVGAGDAVGKLGFLGEEVAMTPSVVADEETVVLSVDGDVIDEVVWASPHAIWAMLCHMSELKHRYARRLVEFTWF